MSVDSRARRYGDKNIARRPTGVPNKLADAGHACSGQLLMLLLLLLLLHNVSPVRTVSVYIGPTKTQQRVVYQR